MPHDLPKILPLRLKGIAGRISGIIRALENDDDPDKILTQFKEAKNNKAHHLLSDEAYCKALAVKIVERINACPGNCGNEDKIESIRNQFPTFTLDELTEKM
ncbi:MAG TPA: metal-sensing transcriptional repressor [Chitinophagaceae bacterium]|nr:metal-sensing transcriptional repressor [Chitinophagaceae bacterium]